MAPSRLLFCAPVTLIEKVFPLLSSSLQEVFLCYFLGYDFWNQISLPLLWMSHILNCSNEYLYNSRQNR